MYATHHSLIRPAGLLAGATLALSAFGAGSATAEADAFPVFDNNYITVSGQAASLNGDKAAFQTRTQQAKSGNYGIEDLRIGKDLSKDVTVQIDGKALGLTDDYRGSVLLTKNDVGSVEFGYKRFRTYYDGVGGFFPINNQWMPLGNEALHVDRGQFWFDAKVALPNKPVFEVRYSNELRDGMKDTTIWGGTDITGIPNVVPNTDPNGTNKLLTYTLTRKLGAGITQIGERHQMLEASMKQKVGNTSFEFKLTGDEVNNLDTRIVLNSPGEVKPFPSPNAQTVIAGNVFNNQVLYTQFDGIKARTLGAEASTETVISSRLTLRTGLSYQLLNSDISGGRPLLTLTPTPTAPAGVLIATDKHFGLIGGSRSKVYTGKIALDYKAAKDLNFNFAIRGEDLYTKSAASYVALASSQSGSTGAITYSSTPNAESSRIKEQVVTPALDIRYTGIQNVALYASASDRINNGDERLLTVNALTLAVGGQANNDTSENYGNYTLGANWRQSAWLTVRGELFRKEHLTKADGYSVNLGDNYALDNQFTGIKLTSIAKATDTVSATTRYIYQKGKMQVTGVLPGAEQYNSANTTNHTIGETIDWNPTTQFYAQGNLNLVYNVIGTIYPTAGYTAPTTTAAGFDSNKVVQNSNNNYVTVNLIAGWVVDKEDDFQVQGNYYRANDGNAVLALWTMPYGVATKDYSVTVGLKHKFDAKLVGNFKVGYFHSDNQTTGGMTNYRGPLVCVTLEKAF
ncbi:MAG TPA: hypothetical protein VMC06_00295 [Opitutaceae bacterium]|nr:hypothetical protein [Opitutaceae bacterium]